MAKKDESNGLLWLGLAALGWCVVSQWRASEAAPPLASNSGIAPRTPQPNAGTQQADAQFYRDPSTWDGGQGKATASARQQESEAPEYWRSPYDWDGRVN